MPKIGHDHLDCPCNVNNVDLEDETWFICEGCNIIHLFSCKFSTIKDIHDIDENEEIIWGVRCWDCRYSQH